MQTTYDPPDVVRVPELSAVKPFRGLAALLSKRKIELEKQGQGTELRRIVISKPSLARVAEDPEFKEEARRVDQGGLRLELPASDVLGLVIGDLLVQVVELAMTPREANARFEELVRRCRDLCPACAADRVPVALDAAPGDRWFHTSVMVGTASMMTPCPAGALRDEMESIRATFG